MQRASPALSPGKAATSACLEAAVPAMGDGHEGVSQHSSRLPAEQDMVAQADRRELKEIELEGTDGAQEATGEAKHGHRDVTCHQSSHAVDMHRPIEFEHRLDATATAMEPDLVPDDDLPLTSLFGSAEAAPLEHHSHRSAGKPESCQRPSMDSAASQPASQESNQENQLPPASDALHRCSNPALCAVCQENNATLCCPEDFATYMALVAMHPQGDGV